MKRLTLFSIGATTGLLLRLTIPCGAQTREIAPASVSEIMRALGPDSKGLTIPADKIPDIFTLTASRVDEDAKKFIIVEPYTSGRWMGGRAVIEYARDLSYTLVSVYDKEGRRQRIYSVVSRTSASEKPTSEPAETNTREAETFPAAVKEEPTPTEAMVSQASTRVVSRSSRSSHKRRPAPAAAPAPAVEQVASVPPATGTGVVGFQWDDERGAYVPIKADNASSSGSSVGTSASEAQPAAATSSSKTSSRSSRKRRHHTTAPAQSAPVQVASVPSKHGGSASPESSGNANDSWVPATVPATASPAKGGTSSSSGGVQNYVWDDKTGSYVPAGAAQPAQPAQTASSTSGSSSRKSRSRHQRSAPSAPAAAPSEPVQVAMNSTPSNSQSAGSARGESSPPAPNPDSEYQLRSKPVTEEDVPSTEDLLANGPGSSAGAETPSQTAAPQPSKRTKRGSHSDSAQPVASAPPTMPQPAAGSTEETPNQRRRKLGLPIEQNFPIIPAGEAAETPNQRRKRLGQSASPEAAPVASAPPPQVAAVTNNTPAPVAEAPAPAPAPPPPPPVRRSRRAAPEQAAPVTAAAPAPEPEAAPVPEPATPESANAGPDTGESDNWKPKNLPPPPPPPKPRAVEKPVEVAMIPKPAPPPDASIESLLKIAAAGKGNAAPNESDNWSPKAGTPAGKQQDAELNAELERARQAEKPVPLPVVKVKRDINNPEEGVLPVNSFEKFSGPRYGRHWEYERRLKLEKLSKAPVKDYDFYVDEVDRKKEIHNLYFYRHAPGSKVPKLVAMERHEHVTFLNNYDVGQESKGKVTKYN